MKKSLCKQILLKLSSFEWLICFPLGPQLSHKLYIHFSEVLSYSQIFAMFLAVCAKHSAENCGVPVPPDVLVRAGTPGALAQKQVPGTRPRLREPVLPGEGPEA